VKVGNTTDVKLQLGHSRRRSGDLHDLSGCFGQRHGFNWATPAGGVETRRVSCDYRVRFVRLQLGHSRRRSGDQVTVVSTESGTIASIGPLPQAEWRRQESREAGWGCALLQLGHSRRRSGDVDMTRVYADDNLALQLGHSRRRSGDPILLIHFCLWCFCFNWATPAGGVETRHPQQASPAASSSFNWATPAGGVETTIAAWSIFRRKKCFNWATPAGGVETRTMGGADAVT